MTKTDQQQATLGDALRAWLAGHDETAAAFSRRSGVNINTLRSILRGGGAGDAIRQTIIEAAPGIILLPGSVEAQDDATKTANLAAAMTDVINGANPEEVADRMVAEAAKPKAVERAERATQAIAEKRAAREAVQQGKTPPPTPAADAIAAGEPVAAKRTRARVEAGPRPDVNDAVVVQLASTGIAAQASAAGIAVDGLWMIVPTSAVNNAAEVLAAHALATVGTAQRCAWAAYVSLRREAITASVPVHHDGKGANVKLINRLAATGLAWDFSTTADGQLTWTVPAIGLTDVKGRDLKEGLDKAVDPGTVTAAAS